MSIRGYIDTIYIFGFQIQTFSVQRVDMVYYTRSVCDFLYFYIHNALVKLSKYLYFSNIYFF